MNGVVLGECESTERGLEIVRLAQRVENEYVGSPCGELDQIMIYFAKKGFGTLYEPATCRVSHLALGPQAPEFAIVALDTGTDRPGLDKSTYKIRRQECDEFAAELLACGLISEPSLAHVRDAATLEAVRARYGADRAYEGKLKRLAYLFAAQQRFSEMLDAWTRGDVERIGAVFRADGLALRDEYEISGPELETMCDLARSVDGVWGERMLGGGDKGAAGAIVAKHAVPTLRAAVARGYARSRPDFAHKFALHEVEPCDGIVVLDGLL